MKKKNDLSRRITIPGSIMLGYLLAGAGWVYFSDNILLRLIRDPQLLSVVQTYKGWFFILLSGTFIYVALSRLYVAMTKAGRKTRRSEEHLRLIFDMANDGIMVILRDLSIVDCNEAGCRMLGVDSKADMEGKTILDYSPETQPSGVSSEEALQRIIETIRQKGSHRFFWRHEQPSGQQIDVEASLKAVWQDDILRIQAVFRDVTDQLKKEQQRQREEANNRILLELHEKAQLLTDNELYDFVLEHAVSLTESKIGFLHLLSDDQQTVFVTAWSKEAEAMCNVSATPNHYSLSEAGNWSDCVAQRKPIIYNDFTSSPNQKGMPEGHMSVQRFMSIPVFEEDQIRIVFGVGNKSGDYDDQDVLQVQLLANDLCKLVRQRHLVEDSKRNADALEEAQRIAHIGNWAHYIATNTITWSKETYRIFGMDPAGPEPTAEQVFERIHPEDRNRLIESQKASVKARTLHEIELRLVLPDGRIRHVFLRGKHQYAEDDTPVRTVGIIQDITARKLAEDALRSSENLRRALLEAVPDPIWLKDEAGVFLGGNQAFEKLMGMPEADLLGKTDYDFMAPEIADSFREHDRVAITAGKPCVNEEWLTPAGTDSHILFETVKAPVKKADGSLIGVLGIARDISWRKQSELELRKAKRQLQYIINNTYEIIYQMDLEGNYIFANTAAERTLGYSNEQLLKMNLRDVVAPEDFPASRIRLQRRIEEKDADPKNASLQVIHQDGHRIWLELSDTGVLDEDGKLIAVQGVARDVSENVMMREALDKQILALTRPLGNLNETAFSDLFSVREIQQLQDEFSVATGVASFIVGPDNELITRPCNGSFLCTDLIPQSELGAKRCKESCRHLLARSSHGPRMISCKSCGLWEASARIVVGGRHVATWVVGQVRDEGITEERVREYARELGLDEEEFLNAYIQVPAMTIDLFKAVAQAMFTLANQISSKAYMNLQQARLIMDEKLRNEELRLFSTAIEQANDAVVITDAKGSIEYVNPAFEHVSGYRMGEVVGKNPRILKGNRHEEAFYKELWDTITAGKSWSGKMQNRHKDGSYFIEETSVSPIYDSEGNIGHYVAVKHNITHVLQLEERFRQSQKMEAVGRLASGVAHDFNNILQSILGTCNILLMETQGQELIQQDIRDILQSAKRAGRLTEQLLTFGRMKSGLIEQIDLNAILDDHLSMLTRLLGKKHQLILELDPSLKPIKADHSQIEQVVMNLVVNAKDAMPSGGQIKIKTSNVLFEEGEVAAHPKGGEFICLNVMDQGTGIEDEVLRNLFDPFFTTKPVGEGSGLGLAIIYSVVDRMNGWVHVDTTVGQGSSFLIYLPTLKPKSTDDANETTKALDAPNTQIAQKKILVIKLDEQDREFAKVVLSSAGYEINVSKNINQALEFLQQGDKNPDLILLSAELSDMLDGISQLLPAEKRIPILIGYDDSFDLEQLEQLRKRGYFFIKKTLQYRVIDQ